MNKLTVSRRAFLKVAAGTGVLVGSAGLARPLYARNKGAVDYADLVKRYIEPAKDSAAVEATLAEVEALTGDQYLTFYELAASTAAKMALPYEPDVESKTLAAVENQKHLMVEAIKSYGRPYNKLSPLEKIQITDTKPTTDSPVSSGGKGKGLAKPQMQAPCYNYTYNASLPLWVGWPNYINYYSAAGAPNCGDVDLEIVYPGFRSIMYNSNPNGSVYLTALRALGKLQVLRYFGNTGALVGNGYVLGAFFGSYYIAAISLVMS